MSILYPVARSAEEALRAPQGHAARAHEAESVAAGAVNFVSEAIGPVFATREALAETFKTVLDQAWCIPLPLAAGRKPKSPVKPIFRDGLRWPKPKPLNNKTHTAVVWRLSISYWRTEGEDHATAGHARKLRRHPGSAALSPKTLNTLTNQPLRPVAPQQPLDIGLFEIHPPEAPHIIMPDE